MAMTLDGTIIDPYNGQVDIKNKVLRHTSEAFKEDPLRVLRLARFRANLGYEWKIAYATKATMSKTWSQLSSLQPDRVWKEIEKVKDLRIFFETLFELNVLNQVFPYIYELTTCKEGNKHHLEPSVFVHTMLMLDILKDQPMHIRMSALYHDIAKPYTYRTYGCSKNHDDPLLIDLRRDIIIPTNMYKQVLFLCKNHTKVYKTYEMSDKTLATWLEQFKSIQQLEDLLILSYADNEGRVTMTETKQIEDNLLLDTLKAILEYSPLEWIRSRENTPNGNTIKQHIHNTNIKFVKYYRNKYEDTDFRN
jgi:tRNA nucleotidyltransferase (CCA-adding enzyme)